jgi:hypothetical protein
VLGITCATSKLISQALQRSLNSKAGNSAGKRDVLGRRNVAARPHAESPMRRPLNVKLLHCRGRGTHHTRRVRARRTPKLTNEDALRRPMSSISRCVKQTRSSDPVPCTRGAFPSLLSPAIERLPFRIAGQTCRRHANLLAICTLARSGPRSVECGDGVSDPYMAGSHLAIHRTIGECIMSSTSQFLSDGYVCLLFQFHSTHSINCIQII